MDKKKLLINIVQKLQWSRKLADGVLALLETAQVDEKFIDTLIETISRSIQSIKAQKQKSLLEKSLEQIQKIQDHELATKESDTEIESILDAI